VTRLASRLDRLALTLTPPAQGTTEVWLVNDDGTLTHAGTGETLTAAELDARGGYVLDLTAPAPNAPPSSRPPG
jgi:hypothetical protein